MSHGYTSWISSKGTTTRTRCGDARPVQRLRKSNVTVALPQHLPNTLAKVCEAPEIANWHQGFARSRIMAVCCRQTAFLTLGVNQYREIYIFVANSFAHETSSILRQSLH